MEKIKIIAHETASIILFNALCAQGDEMVNKIANKTEKGTRDVTIDCELTIGGEVIPIVPFFDRIWEEIEREAKLIADKRVNDLIKNNPILQNLSDLQEELESKFREIGWHVTSKLQEMGVEINDDE